jgi:hypothetical protein
LSIQEFIDHRSVLGEYELSSSKFGVLQISPRYKMSICSKAAPEILIKFQEFIDTITLSSPFVNTCLWDPTYSDLMLLCVNANTSTLVKVIFHPQCSHRKQFRMGVFCIVREKWINFYNFG